MRARQFRLVVNPALLAILLAFPAQQALATNCTWNPVTGNWNAAANWITCAAGNGNPAQTPGAADTAGIGTTGVVTIDTGQSVLVLNNAGSINIDAYGLNLVGGGSTTNSGVINVGGASTANLSVSAGHNINNAGGVINVATGSVVNQFGSTITGGTINTTGTGQIQAFSSGSNILSGVTLNGTLDLASVYGIERVVNGLALNGTANIGKASILAPQGNQTIGGNGNIVFTDANASNRLNVEAGNLTLASGITVHGNTGFIGQQNYAGGAATLTNNGTIAADVAGGTITLQVNGATTNNATLAALNGGTLLLNSNIVGNTGSQIVAGAGSVVVQNAITISGDMNLTGAGSFRASGSGSNVINGVTLAGTLDLASAYGIERVTGGLTLNNSTINIAKASILAPQGNQTIGGNGNIVFTDANASNRLNVEAGNLTLASGITVHGNTGFIGQQSYAGGAATLTNNGTIAADVAGGTITLQVNGATTNNGTLAALNGGTLLLNSNITNAVGSQILASNGGKVVQNGVNLNGTINVASGAIQVSASGSNFFDTVNFTGLLDLATNNSIERVVGGLTLNNSTINIAKASILAPQGNQTIGGNGNIVFTDANASNRLNVEAGNLTLASGITVHGNTGFIGQQNYAGGAATLTNNGTIAADVAGGTVTLQVNGATTNNATLAALNGGTLLLNSNIVGNTGSQIVAGAGSVVVQNAITISGDMNLTGAGSFRASGSGSNVISGVTLAGTLDLASAYGIERVIGGLTLAGATINIGNNSILAPAGNQTISGTGTINFADDGSASNRLSVDAGNLVLGSGVTVRGGNGSIGPQVYAGGAATLTNQGLISADVNGRSITVGVNGAVINQGTMRAQNGGRLQLDTGGGYDNSAGTLLADSGSTVLLNSAVVTGGLLNSNGSGVFKATASGSNNLNGVTLNGVLDLASANGIVRVTNGGMTLNGTINIGANSILAPAGNQTISGTGAINFADASASNRLVVDAGNLVLGSDITVHGQNGTIGGQIYAGGAATLTNNGTINSDGGGVMTVNVNGALTNNGTMRAQNGTLNIQNALSGTGTLQVDTTGVMSLANGGNTQGKLVMGAAGSAITIGNGNLTVTNDYTNTGAGTGNSFNRRAGVTGTGLIVAGGNAAQVITGTDVTGGNTANATLTLGNVRVGSTNFNYQVANTGTTGPVLRGVIQTTANGGNLTDARLSGAGVTASNYNAGAPGSNSGNLGVIFTAASAGALAPLSGQVLNLRSNFENIADQKLNIVLAGGAAAYNAAVGGATPSPAVVANQRVGGSNSAVLTVSNAAASGSFSEDLRATFGSNGGAALNNGGSAASVLAGSNNASAMTAGVNTASAGAKTGSVTLNYETLGAVNGISNGLGTASVGSQTINVSGNVYNVAVGSTMPTPITIANQRIGGSNSQVLTVANTAAAGGFSEALNANLSSTGAATGSGNALNIAAGANSTALSVGVNTSTAGAKSGTAVLAYQTDGTGSNGNSGLAAITAGSQNITVSGNVYQAAAGALQGNVLNFGTLQVGQQISQGMVVRNTASGAAGFVEDLNASFGASGNNQITGSGALNNILAGTNSSGANGTMMITVTGATAGVLNSSIAVNYASTGAVNGVSNGLGTLAVGSENFGVNGTINASGNVINQASPQINTAQPINLGNVRQGAVSPTANVSVSNVATVAPQAALSASITGNAPITASGSFNLLNPNGTDNSSLSVGMNTGNAGAVNGTATIAFVSDASNVGNCAPNCQVNIASQNVNVTGAVYRLANPQSVTPSLTLAARVGGSASGNVSITNQSPDIYTEALKVQAGAAPNGFNVGGNPANIAAQDTGTLQVSLNTATAGTSSGTLTLNNASTGAGTTNAADVSVGASNVTLTGKVYTAAQATVQPAVNFGIVHVGEVVAARGVSVQNSAPVTALNDTLAASIGGATGSFTSNNGSVAGLVAGGAANTAALKVGVNTATAGILNGTANLALTSQNPDMADLALGSQSVALSAQVNKYANAEFGKVTGAGGLTRNGSIFTLDFGTAYKGSGTLSAIIDVENLVNGGPSDFLNGSLNIVDGNDFFVQLLLASFSNVAADASSGSALSFLFDTNTLALGSYQDSVALNWFGTNGSGYQGADNLYTLQVIGTILQQGANVPEPNSLLLLTIALFAGFGVSRRRRSV